MTEKKNQQTTQDGAVELNEASLDDASGGILIGLNKVATDVGAKLTGGGIFKLGITDGTSNIKDGTSNIFKL